MYCQGALQALSPFLSGGEGRSIGEAKEDADSQKPLPKAKIQADGSVEGESDGEDDNAEARIYAELIEEQQAKKRAAALDGLNEINTGQVSHGHDMTGVSHIIDTVYG